MADTRVQDTYNALTAAAPSNIDPYYVKPNESSADYLARNAPVPRYPTASPTPTPAPSSGYVDSSISGMFDRGGVFGDRSMPNQEAIRASLIAGAQGTIDAVNQAANSLIKNETDVNAPERLGRARALAARGGNIGSTIYEQGQKPAVMAQNSGALAAIENDRVSKIGAIMSQISAQATGEYNAKLAQSQGNAQAYANFLKGSESSTRDGVKNLAAAGVSWDILSKDPEYAKELSSMLKYGNFRSLHDLEAFYNASKPAAQKIDYTSETIKGDNGNAWILRYGIDPTTGQMTTQKGDLGINYDAFKGSGKTLEQANGIFYTYDPSNGTLTKIGGTPTSIPRSTTTSNPTSQFTTSQYNRLNTAGVSRQMANDISAAILHGSTLQAIREALVKDGNDPKLLDYFDNVIGIKGLLHSDSPTTKPAGFG